MAEMEILVGGMSCNHCKMNVEKAIKSLEKVNDVQVDLESGKVKITGEESLTAIKEAIEETGFEVLS